MPKVGGHGLDMMYRTCTIQANLDFASEADMVKKMRVGLALQPVATALFANSPFTRARPTASCPFAPRSGATPIRDRTGMLPFAFEPGMGFERYVDWALDVPMYFVKRGETLHRCGRAILPRSHGGALRGAARRACRPSPTGPTTCPRFSPRSASSGTWKCAAPMADRGGGSAALPAYLGRPAL